MMTAARVFQKSSTTKDDVRGQRNGPMTRGRGGRTDDVGQHEVDPRVRPRRPLSDLVGLSLLDELRHDLLDELTEDGEELKQSEGCQRSCTKAEGGVSGGLTIKTLKSWFWRPCRLVSALKNENPMNRGCEENQRTVSVTCAQGRQ